MSLGGFRQKSPRNSRGGVEEIIEANKGGGGAAGNSEPRPGKQPGVKGVRRGGVLLGLRTL